MIKGHLIQAIFGIDSNMVLIGPSGFQLVVDPEFLNSICQTGVIQFQMGFDAKPIAFLRIVLEDHR